MSRLLIICQKVDESDDLLGFFVSWIREFAKHYDRVTVIALGAGEVQLPDNVTVYSLGKESGVARWRRWLGLLNLLRREVKNHDAVFCHMSPIFAVAAAPFTKAWHKRLVLWYLHRSNTLRLRIALWLIDTLVTADADSLTIMSPKIHVVGHGIDVAAYAPEGDPWGHRGGFPPLDIVSVGRISRIKNYETLLHAAAILRDEGIRTHVDIVGKPAMNPDAEYLRELDALRRELSLEDTVRFTGYVPHTKMRDVYMGAEIVVGCTPPGGIDKVLLEAMSSGCVVFTSNTVMRRHLPSWYADDLVFRHGDARDLAEKIRQAVDRLGDISQDMQYVVYQNHNLPVTIGKIAALL
jgi:glycosyltransferase involved in cell wall biosynthesis